MRIGTGAWQLLGLADPEAKALVNAAVTGYGDTVQAVKEGGAKIEAGQTITLKVSAALAAASQGIWPNVEKPLAAFEGVIGPQAPTPPAPRTGQAPIGG